MASAKDLAKVEAVSDLINELASSNDSENAMKKADAFLADIEKKESSKSNGGFSHTNINHDAYKNDDQKQPQAHAPDDQNAFMAAVSADAKERAERRSRNRVLAEKKKARANVFFNAGDTEKAIELYSQGLELSKDFAQLYTNRALAYMRISQPDKALVDCDWALMVEDTNVKALIQRGKALLALKRPEESRESFKRVLEVDPAKSKLVGDYLAEVDQFCAAVEREKLALERFKAAGCHGDGGVVDGDVVSLILRLANQSHPIMYYTGGLRLLASRISQNEVSSPVSQSVCSSEEARTLFRTKGGFKLICPEHKVTGSVILKPLKDQTVEERTLLVSIIELATAIVKDDTENQKLVPKITSLSDRIIECLTLTSATKPPASGTIENRNDLHSLGQLLRSQTVDLLLQCSKSETGRRALVERISPALLLAPLFRLLRETTTDRLVAIRAAALCHNLAQSRQFLSSLSGQLDQQLLRSLEDLIASGACLQAMPTCVECLVSLCGDTDIVKKLASRKELLLACTKAFERHAPLHAEKSHEDLLTALVRLLLTLSLRGSPTFSNVAFRLLNASASVLTELHGGQLRGVIILLISQLMRYLTKEEISGWCSESQDTPPPSSPSNMANTPSWTSQLSHYPVSPCVRLLLTVAITEGHPQLSSAIQILAVCVQHHDNTRFLVGDDANFIRHLRRLVRVHKGFDEYVAGNVAILMQNCVNDTQLAETLTDSSIIQDLLTLVQEATNTDVRRNAAILTGCLATANQRHRDELSRLEGWSILAPFNQWPSRGSSGFSRLSS